MSSERPEQPQNFLSRWSRLKAESREAPAAEQPPPQSVDQTAAPQLPPIEELTLDSDFKGFFHPKVAEDTRRAALRKLFSDPHFNVMDGLDVYIDDYSKTEPIPAAMLASLKQAQRILAWARNEEERVEEGEEAPTGHDASAALSNDAPSAPARIAPELGSDQASAAAAPCHDVIGGPQQSERGGLVANDPTHIASRTALPITPSSVCGFESEQPARDDITKSS